MSLPVRASGERMPPPAPFRACRADRIADRPDPGQWGEDEILSLEEAVRLLWPKGPISVRTLRTAISHGSLAVADIAGKFFVTKRALAEMCSCSFRARAGVAQPPPDDGPIGEAAARDFLAGKTR